MDKRDPAAEPGTAVNTKTRSNRFPLGTAIALLGIGLLAALVWYLTRDSGSSGSPAATRGAPTGAAAGRPAGRASMATTVGIARAELTDIPVQLDALGTVASPATAVVRAQVSGVLRKVHYTEGQTVKAGQLLAEIDPRPFEMALQQASGQRQRDEAQLANARVLLKRYQTLLEQDSIARQEVDTQAALVQQLEGTVATDRAAENAAKLNLSYTKVTAPIAGRLGLRTVDVGNMVGPGDTNGVAVITQMTPIDVVFSVPQDQLPDIAKRLNAGEAMQVTAWDRSGNTLLATGKFLALDNQIDVQTGTARAKARFDNQALTLFPGQFVNVRLQMRTIADSVVIPVAALRHGNAGDFVYVLNAENRTVKLTPVKAGRFVDDKVQILSGLQAGMSVITEGADRLQDGAAVNLASERSGARATGAQQGAQPGAQSGVQSGAQEARQARQGPSPNGNGERRRPAAAGGEAGAAPAAGNPVAVRKPASPAQ